MMYHVSSQEYSIVRVLPTISPDVPCAKKVEHCNRNYRDLLDWCRDRVLRFQNEVTINRGHDCLNVACENAKEVGTV